MASSLGVSCNNGNNLGQQLEASKQQEIFLHKVPRKSHKNKEQQALPAACHQPTDPSRCQKVNKQPRWIIEDTIMKPENVRDIICFCRFHQEAFAFPNKTHWIIYPLVSSSSLTANDGPTHFRTLEWVWTDEWAGSRGKRWWNLSPFTHAPSSPAGSEPALVPPSSSSPRCCSSAAKAGRWPALGLASTTPTPRATPTQLEPGGSPWLVYGTSQLHQPQHRAQSQRSQSPPSAVKYSLS